MAQQTATEDNAGWEVGETCEIFIDHKQQWITAKVIAIFDDDEGKWVEVQFGRNKIQLAVNSTEIRKLSENEETSSDMGWKKGSQCELYSREMGKWIEGEIINIFNDTIGRYLRVQYGPRVQDVNVKHANHDLRAPGTSLLAVTWDDYQKLQAGASDHSAIGNVLKRILAVSEQHHFGKDVKSLVNCIYGTNTDLAELLYIVLSLCCSKESLSWFNLMQCVSTELFPAMSVKISQAIQDKLLQDTTFKMTDIGKDAVSDIIQRLMKKRTMNNIEISYLKAMFNRARKHEKEDQDALRIVLGMRQNDRHQIDDKCPGLNLQMLVDIYGVHKALRFGTLQRSDYTLDDFTSDINKVNRNLMDKNRISFIIRNQRARFSLSFYPRYLINDDIFAIMACHFAMSAVVNEMKNDNHVDGLCVRSIVVPTAACSRYDDHEVHQTTIENLGEFIRSVSPDNLHVSRRLLSDIADVPEMTEILHKLVGSIKNENIRDIVVVFDRQNVSETGTHPVWAFECLDMTDLDVLRNNYCLTFDFEITGGPICDIDTDGGNVVRCWLSFGMSQRLRYFPEYAVWIIPHLFVRPTKMTTYEVIKALYADDYKHGWRVALDDEVFNKYYHIISGYEHISNNYNRQVVASTVFAQRLITEYLEQNVDHKSYTKLAGFMEAHDVDSDALLQDIQALSGKCGCKIDERDSNIAALLGSNSREWRNLKFTLLRFDHSQCKMEAVRHIDDCECINSVIRNLQKFQEYKMVIDASNVYEFDLESIISGFDHLQRVHNFLSDDVKKQEIQSYIAERVNCDEEKECVVSSTHYSRNRERLSLEEKTEVPLDEVGSLCELIADALESMHCYVLHRDDQRYRLISGQNSQFTSRFTTDSSRAADSTGDDPDVQNEDEKDDMKEERSVGNKAIVPTNVNFGLNVLCWLQYGENPLYETLKLEITKNPLSTVDLVMFNLYREMCIAKIKKTKYTVYEMLCLKLYSDTNELQALLRRAHWTSAQTKVRKSYYQWAMGLYRTHLYHAKPIPTATTSSGSETSPCKLFHGLNQMFTMTNEQPIYYGPLSTTLVKNVAWTFSKNRGQIWLIQSSYVNPLRFCIGIPMGWISAFKREREVLLCNQFLPIQKMDTFDDDPQVMVNHLMFSLLSRTSPIVERKKFWKLLGVGFNVSWIPQILEHKLLFDISKCSGLTVIKRLRDELQIPFFRMMNHIQEHMAINEGDIAYLMPADEIYTKNLPFAEYVFAANLGDEVPEDVEPLMLESAEQFQIPCDHAFRYGPASLKFTVFVSTEQSFGFVPIHSTILPRYRFQSKQKQVISDRVNILTSDQTCHRNRSLVINCAADITFDEKSSISGNGVGVNSEGGTIRIISDGNVTNMGSLCCNGLNGAEGGNIYIVADLFVNFGKMECERNGGIHIFCREFRDHGNISPKPKVVQTMAYEYSPVQKANVSALNAVNYLMHFLRTSRCRIADVEAFYREIGLRLESTWIQLIVDHKMLFEVSEFEGKRVIDRLHDELNIDFFGFYKLLCGSHSYCAFRIDANNEVIFRGTNEMNIDRYRFFITFDGEHPHKKFHSRFINLAEFKIPVKAAGAIDDLLMYLHIYCKEIRIGHSQCYGYIRIGTVRLSQEMLIKHYFSTSELFESLSFFSNEMEGHQWVNNLLMTDRQLKDDSSDNSGYRLEFMTTMFDVFCRLTLDCQVPAIFGTVQEVDAMSYFQHFFVDYVRVEDKLWDTLKGTFCKLQSGSECEKMFQPMTQSLPDQVTQGVLIPDDAAAFQSISCSFLLFIKAFMCSSGNELEVYGHEQENGVQEPVTESLKDWKKDTPITEEDVEFCTFNFPLHFDLVIIPKGDKSDESDNVANLAQWLFRNAQDDLEFDGFAVVSKDLDEHHWTLTNLKNHVYALYGDMIRLFRKMLLEQKNKNETGKRRDNRYCIVIDRTVKKMYMFPPHIHIGDDASSSNMFSIIPQEYSEYTNFYLSQQCIFPDKRAIQHSGVGDIQFMLSAHFHRGKKWHRHPKLKMYQYFNGKGMRFFHSSLNSMTGYAEKMDMIDLWPAWFEGEVALDAEDIDSLGIFDAVMDLYKCDRYFVRWDCAVRRQWVPVDVENYYCFQAWSRGNDCGFLNKEGKVAEKDNAKWKVERCSKVRRSKEDDAINQIAYTLKCGKKYLGIKEQKQNEAILCMEASKVAKSKSIPLMAFAWTLEKYFDEEDFENPQLMKALSIKNVHCKQYLACLVSSGNHSVEQWEMLPVPSRKRSSHHRLASSMLSQLSFSQYGTVDKGRRGGSWDMSRAKGNRSP